MAIDRKSNMELLRIVAMVLVMIVHASVYTMNGLPTVENVHNIPLPSFSVFFFEGLSIVCVNVFVLLSGWFGVKFKLMSIAKLVFQVFFFTILVFIALSIFKPEEYMNMESFSYIFLIPGPQLWFVKAYVVLIIFAPVLNSFVEHTSRKQLLSVILIFFIFQSIYGWLFMDATPWIGGGYSVTSFVGIYLLARYANLYGIAFDHRPANFWIMIYIGIALLHALLAFVITYKGMPIAGRLFTFTNPLVILQSLALLLAFSKMRIKSKVVNSLASSAFAVYLVHGHEQVLRGFYGPFFVQSFRCNSFGIYLLFAVCFITSIFFVSILIDRFRMWVWNLIYTRYLVTVKK